MVLTNEKGERLRLTADAFLLAALIYMVATGIAVGIVGLVAEGGIGTAPVEMVFQIGSMFLSVAAVFGGAIWAWRLHDRPVVANAVAGMVMGAVVGIAAAILVMAAVGFLFSRLPLPQDQPPWIVIGLLGAVVLAYALVPIVDAIRDLTGEKRHVTLDWLRLAAFVIAAAIAVVILPMMGAAQGNELGEAGVFMLPFAVGAAFAAAGADVFMGWLGKRKDAGPIAT